MSEPEGHDVAQAYERRDRVVWAPGASRPGDRSGGDRSGPGAPAHDASEVAAARRGGRTGEGPRHGPRASWRRGGGRSGDPGRRRGRHVRPALPSCGAGLRLRVAAAGGRGRVALGAGAAGLGLALLALIAGRGADRVPGDGAVDVMSRRPVAVPSAAPAASPGGPARGPRASAGDQAVLAYVRVRDRRAARHVRKVMWTGPMLRVYTDLPGSAVNSRTAVRLCAVAAGYLDVTGRSPVVFVHARRADGYPVLANKMDEDDDCRLNRVP